MKKIKVLVTALFLLATAGMVQAQTKVAHINSAKLMEILPAVKDAQKSLDTATMAYQNALGAMEQQIKALELEIQTKEMDEITREIKLQEYQDKVKRYQAVQADAQAALQKLQIDLFNPIIEDLKKTITEVAKEKGYDYVLDSQDGGIMIYGNESYDLMNDVKKKLNLQ